MELKEWILERISPVIMVVSSPEVDAMVGDANGLTVADLLRPHGFLRHLSAPVRTVGEHAYRIRELCLRFYASASIFQPSPEVADAYLRSMLSRVAKESDIRDVPDALAALKKGEVQATSPWFERYRSEFFRMLAFAEHETFDHPVACLLVLGTDVPDPARAFADLFETASLPPLMQQGFMEHRILKHYLLLHDDSQHDEASFHRAEEKLRALKSTLGVNSCHLLRINSGTGNPKDIQGYERLWRAHVRDCLPGGGAGEGLVRPRPPPEGLGARLTADNLEDIRHFLEAFVVRSLLPSLEARVRALNHQVTSARKGLRNQLKTLLFRKSGPETPRASAVAPAGVYGPSTLEGQMRQLADLAFMMQDYDTATSTFRLLASDYKADKAWRHYSAVQEMLGLTAFVSGSSTSMSEVVAFFKDAFYRYNSSKDNVRYATRCMMLLADYCRQHSLFQEANYALMKAHFQEENLRAALLLEAAAHCLLQVSPPCIRKFAFHMVLAGLRYNACDQKQLGLKAYRQVLPIYAGRHWNYIEEHLNDVLGKQSRDNGDLDSALTHFLAMLPSGHSSEHWQTHYLTQFLQVVQLAEQRPEGAPVLELPLPEIDMGNVRACFDNAVCHADVAARNVPEELWKQLEAPLLQGSDSRLSSLWLDVGGSRANLAAITANLSVAGEAISVEVPMTNPLVLELNLSEVALLYEHESGQTGPSNDYVEVYKQEVTMQPQERRVVTLQLLPKQAGQLTIKGIEWVLNGHARGRCLLTPKQKRSARPDLRGSQPSLAFNVISPRPRLQVEVEGVPQNLLEGELVCATLVMQNPSPVGLQALRCVVSSEDVHVAPSNSQPGGLSDSGSLRGGLPGGTELEERGFIMRGGQTVYGWPSTCQLAPGEVVRWPVWFHPRPGGPLVFRCVWAYEAVPDALKDGFRFRTLRMVKEVGVTPCVTVTPTLQPSRTDLRNSILRLDLACKEAVGLRRITTTSPGFRLSAMASNADPPSQFLDFPPTTTFPPASRAFLSCYLHPNAHPPDPPSEGGVDEAGIPAHVAHFHARRQGPTQGGAAAEGAERSGKGGRGPASLSAADAEAAAAARRDGPPSLLLEWEVAGTERCGVTHLMDVMPQEPATLRAVVKGAGTLRHDFAADSVCTAQVTLHVRNCMGGAASLSIEANPTPAPGYNEGSGAWRTTPYPSGPGSAGLGSTPKPIPGANLGPTPAKPYVWCGRTRTHVPSLERDQEVALPLQIAIFAPGLYEVNDYVVHWSSAVLNKAKETMPGPRFLISVQGT